MENRREGGRDTDFVLKDKQKCEKWSKGDAISETAARQSKISLSFNLIFRFSMFS